MRKVRAIAIFDIGFTLLVLVFQPVGDNIWEALLWCHAFIYGVFLIIIGVWKFAEAISEDS